MGKIILTTILTTAFGVMFTGCGESEESKRNLELLSREAEAQRLLREEAAAERLRRIEEARKWHHIQMEAYEKSMTPEKE